MAEDLLGRIDLPRYQRWVDRMAEALEDVGAAIAGEALANFDLDKMAEELGECYEELHLVFTMSAHDYARAWEDQDAMRALLQSTAKHMGADMAAFVRPADGLC